MKKKYFLTFLITSVVFGQNVKDLNPLLSKGDVSFDYNVNDDFIEKSKLYKIRDNSIVIESFENEISSDTIKLDTELDIYNIKVSKTENIYVTRNNQNYLVDNLKLIPIDNYNDVEFSSQTNEIKWNATFSESEKKSINDFFELNRFYGYDVEGFNMRIYELGDTRLFICDEQTLGYGSYHFLFKINQNDIAELLYIAEIKCNGSTDCGGEDFFVLNDVLYIIGIDPYNNTPPIYKTEGSISTNFTLSNPVIPLVKDGSIYVVENDSVRIMDNNYSISVYNLQGQKVENSNLINNQIYFFKIKNNTTKQVFTDKIIVQ